ncbi:hypothetical protein EKO04_007071 [Ascochyta lentis]|uniref:Swi5-domain-containing protein n=1 Tax=Ascochyta lentis TaxID=205686 RepID=A0A8H7J4A8_9PLEO|nr:hypothetical protein EKO04_007071 [Ascochyta lentis]
MAVGTGVTEIADSEEEPLTSSPAAVPDAAANKLSSTADQDAQATAWLHQDLAESIANESSSRTDGLDGDQGKSSSNVETAQIDHVDLHLALQADTNTTSACTTKNEVQADVCPLQANVAASNADHTGSIDMHGTDGEVSAAQDPEHLPATGSLIQHDPHTSIPTSTQVKSRDSQEGTQQPGVPGSLSANSALSTQDEAYGNRIANLGSTANDPAHLVSDQQDISQDGTAMSYIIGARDGDNEHSAGSTQQDMALASSIGPPASNVNERPYANLNMHPLIFLTGDISDSTDLVYLPAASGLTTSQTSSAQNPTNVAPKRLDVHDGRNVSENLEPDLFTRSASAPASPADDELTSTTNDHAMGGDETFPHSAAGQNMVVYTQEAHAEQQSSIDASLGTEASDINTKTNHSKQAPAETPAEQSLEKRHVLMGGGVRSVAEQTPEPGIQSSVAEVHSHREHDTKVDIDPNLESTAPATHTQSQFSASQTGEPVSPRPAVKLSPQEITLAELKAQKAALLASLVALPAIQVLIEENQTYDVDMSEDDSEPTETDITAAANKMVKEHIKLLHEYNELKDVGQGLMGLIADQRGVRIVEVQDEFGLDAND